MKMLKHIIENLSDAKTENLPANVNYILARPLKKCELSTAHKSILTYPLIKTKR